MNAVSINFNMVPVSGVAPSAPAASTVPVQAAEVQTENTQSGEVFSMSDAPLAEAIKPAFGEIKSEQPSEASAAPLMNADVASCEGKQAGIGAASSALPSTVGAAAAAAASSVPEDEQLASAIAYYTNVSECEPEISSMMQEIAGDQDMGMEGFQYRLKGWDSFLRKIRSSTPDYVINDVVRYTMTASPETLAGKVSDSMAAMEKKGYKTVVVKNTWDDETRAYKGINTTVRTPEGILFEVQYHTPESYAMKDSMHALYEEWRLLDPESPRAIELDKQQMEMSRSLTRPDHVETIVPFNIEG